MGLVQGWIHDFFYGNRLTAAVRILLGCFFVLSGVSKALDPEGFGRVIALYDILPADAIPYAAIIIPMLECIIGLNLVLGVWVKAACLTAFPLMASFIVAISINLARGRSFDCGCIDFSRFGFVIPERLGPGLLVRNGVLLLLFALQLRASRYCLSVEGLAERMRLRSM